MAEEPEDGAEALNEDVRADEQAPNTETREAPADDPEIKALSRVARSMGWAPKTDWRGDPAKWVDAEQFIAKTAEINKGLKDQVHRISRATETIIARERRDMMEKAQEQVRQAAMTGDPDEIATATQNLTRVATATNDVDTQQAIADFRARNSWLESSPSAAAFAVAETNRLAAAGASVPAQLEAAEREVRKRFPELFGDARPAVKDPALVSGGQRIAQPSQRAKSLSDLPAAERKEVEHMIKLGMVKDAADYFAAAQESGAR